MEAMFGESACIDSWMQLVRKVSWNFPGLETEERIDEHEQTVLKFMNKKQALCVQSQETVIGVLLFSRSNKVSHFVVSEKGVDTSRTLWYLFYIVCFERSVRSRLYQNAGSGCL